MPLVKKLRAFEPTVMAQLEHPALAWAKPWVVKRRLLQFSVRSTALGVAFGFLAGAIPGPLQVITALLLCLVFRANVIAAVVASAWTNPLTIAPIYLAAHAVGRFVLPGEYPVPTLNGFSELSEGGWISDLGVWATQLGTPLLVGLPILAATLAVLGYFAVVCVWRKSDDDSAGSC
jgi:uncharacterized protein